MKTNYFRSLKIKNVSFILLIIFALQKISAQVDTQPKDTIGFNKGKIKLKNPTSILSAYTYDPVTDRYIYSNTVGGFNINYPVILTPKEYQELVAREGMRKYFKEKSDAIDGKKPGSEEAKKNLLPRFYVNNNIFETIFGSNTIDVKPTGSVEMDLGMRYSKQDNPALSPRNRTTSAFDFTQRINMSLTGKVGTRLNVNANYDTQSTFAFQNLIKLEYQPDEDAILQKLEVGNISMPLSSTLIKGAQSLFGVKTQLQFGKTTITGVYSEQKSQTKAIKSQGGGTVQEFNVFALDYDADRHFFLSQYFRNRYDSSLKSYPLINSRVQITRLEIWVTNKNNRVSQTENNLRNIVALQDLGEGQLTGFNDNEIVNLNNTTSFFINPPDTPTDNSNNRFDPALIESATGFLNSNIREVVTTNNNAFTLPASTTVSEGQDYAKLENARKLTASEYTFNPQLGYISLQQRLSNDEILAVAYQYTIGDKVYQVGEFGNGGVESTIVGAGTPTNQAIITQSLILKMLKSTITTVTNPVTKLTTPIWNLMMKNIYQIAPGGQLEQADFRFNIVYTDPTPLNYISPVSATNPLPADVDKTPLLKVFNVDRLNSINDPEDGGDGFFDFIPNITVDPQYGRIIFTTVEPFGKHLFEKLKTSPLEDYNDVSQVNYNENQKKFVFRNMYRSTQTGALQSSDKNKFQLRGKYKSTAGDGIAIGAFNVPKGSVVVKSGGRVLLEGVDYSVNYQLGRVIILDPAIQASNMPLDISVENNSVFGQQTRRFIGVNVEHKFSDKFMVGGTYLNMTEKPFTQKSSYGQESVSNTIFGFNTNFSTEIPFLTRLVNKLPNIDTDVVSNFAFKGEVAFLRPDSPTADRFQGESTVYVDDFEGSQTTIDMKAPSAWSLASVPLWKSGVSYNNFGLDNATDPPASISDGFKRAKISWYAVDPTFYTSQRPSGISDLDMAADRVRRIYSSELFPETDIAVGQPTVINTLDLSYYPSERGPYNFNPTAVSNTLTNPKDNFGGIIRSINTTNFEQGNVEYIQFWVLDPYYNNEIPNTNIGKVFFNLGQISEDVLRDGKKQYENGLPEAGASQNTLSSVWGQTPVSQSLIYAFDANDGNRAVQDVGLDGFADAGEATKFPNFAGLQDPSADNYQFYLDANGSVLERYKNYNGLESNSPVLVGNTRGNTTNPDAEDINRDNTMNTINAYYQYSIDINANMKVGDKYISDVRIANATNPTGGDDIKSRWIQFKIPIEQGSSQVKFGTIEDFRSIQFMRLFLTGFSDQITLRFGTLDLVRGEWRRFANSLEPGGDNPDNDNTGFDVSAVNIQENGERTPIKYVTPPAVVREQVYNNNTLINQNEQSLSIRISNSGLEADDSRAVFKTVNVDMRQSKKLNMFLHAESLVDDNDVKSLKDNQMSGFIRFGNDFTQNYYQIEKPLKVTLWSDSATAEKVWPEENNLVLPLSLLTKIKILAMQHPEDFSPEGVYSKFDYELDSNILPSPNSLKISVRGNPNFGVVRTLMVGVRNNKIKNLDPDDNSVLGEVWFNELRLSGSDNSGGMAAIASIDTNLADFATISASGSMNTIGFGAIEDKPNERSRSDSRQYSFVTNLNAGKLLPKKWGINLPFNYAVGEQFVLPKYDPFNQDIILQDLLDITENQSTKDNLKNRAIEYTKNQSINFIGVKKERGPDQKQRVYDPENLTLSYSYNQILKHDFEIEDYVDQQLRTSAVYAYTFKSKPLEPFKKNKFLNKSEYWKLLTDFNFNYLPSSINFSSDLTRQYNRQQFRQIEVEGIGLTPLYRRNYLFNYQYGFNYNLTKTLKLNFTASTNNIVRNYLNEFGKSIEDFSIWDDYWNIGEPNQHNQQLSVNYELPINKLPFLSFLKSSYTYTGDYNWQRASQALSSYTNDLGVTYNLGNTIQNNGSHKINAALNMDLFYKYVGLIKNNVKKPTNQKTPPKPGEKVNNNKTNIQTEENPFKKAFIGVLTSLKNVQANFTQSGGTVLPGYLPSLGFFGSSKPTLGFVFGIQDDVRFEAFKNGWLTDYPDFNQNYTTVVNKNFDMTANMDLFPDFKIDLTANRTFAENYSEQYDLQNNQYNSRSPYSFGNFSISTNLLRTAFGESDETTSASFDNFRNNRLVIANRLATERGIDISNPANLDAENYPIGYGKNAQAVLLPAFLAAYTGENANGVSLGATRNIPIPNWVIKYSGLMKLSFFKDNFKRFSLQHGYRSSYTINSIRSNFEFDKNPNGFDQGGNFNNRTLISNINLVEQFNPLIKIDMEMKNNIKIVAEMKKDRALSMSFDNNLLTEVKGLEYILGLGYRIKDVIIHSSFADNPNGIIKSDINIKVDFSMRNNKTIVRNLDYNNNRLGGGQELLSAKLTADYNFSKNLSAILFYDHSFTKAVISTSYPVTNIRGGFTVRYNFGN